jgi:fumarylacetoacetate (FAA) hydrolase
MRLATLRNGTPDGALAVVSSDASRYVLAATVAPTLQAALDDWRRVERELRRLALAVESGDGVPLDDRALAAPLPRAWQGLDGSAFDAHGRLMTRLFGLEAKQSDRPLMYQGLSHQFLGPCDDVPLPRETDEIDFEGEFGVVTDAVPTSAIWGVTATGHDMFRIVTLGLSLGCDLVRVGFEDALQLPDGSIAADNSDMVRAALDIAAIYGMQPASVAEARARVRI